MVPLPLFETARPRPVESLAGHRCSQPPYDSRAIQNYSTGRPSRPTWAVCQWLSLGPLTGLLARDRAPAAGDHDVNSAGKPSPDSHSALFGRPGILEVTVMIMIVTRSPSVAAVDSEERRGPRNGCPRKICTHVCLNTSLIPSVKFKFLVCFLSSNFETG